MHRNNYSATMSTDMYNLSMAQVYWKLGRHNDQAIYHVSYRNNPFKGGFIIASGLEPTIKNLINNFNINNEEYEYLIKLKDKDNKNLFSKEFVDFLQNTKLYCDIYAPPEGTILFPNEPLLRVSGPILQCQIIETLLLNNIGFQTLLSTKAARVCLAAKNKPVIEFGMRRAHSLAGSILATRSAFIGGCQATSNMAAGQKFGIAVCGTQSHSWVSSFDKEEDAFKQYALNAPNSMCIFTVDTYSTIEGIRNAIKVAKDIETQGRKLLGIRIDSGDLAWLSKQARIMLDAVGLSDTKIFASNEIDEYIIESIENEGAKIDCWGVGTKIVTGGDTNSLGCVYKLSALKTDTKNWQHKIKISEQPIKTSIPGMQQIKRFIGTNGEYIGDMVFDELTSINTNLNIIDALESTHRKQFSKMTKTKLVLEPIIQNGKLVYDFPTIQEIQNFAKSELQSVHSCVKRFINPYKYPAGLEKNLYELREKMIKELK